MLNVNETVTSIKPCYKIRYLSLKIWRYAESPYLCNVFFIVLDLRLTKDWLSGIDSLFLCSFPSKNIASLSGRDGYGSPDKPGGLSIQLCKSEKKEFYIRYSS